LSVDDIGYSLGCIYEKTKNITVLPCICTYYAKRGLNRIVVPTISVLGHAYRRHSVANHPRRKAAFHLGIFAPLRR
jgi:hypothetical protein